MLVYRSLFGLVYKGSQVVDDFVNERRGIEMLDRYPSERPMSLNIRRKVPSGGMSNVGDSCGQLSGVITSRSWLSSET